MQLESKLEEKDQEVSSMARKIETLNAEAQSLKIDLESAQSTHKDQTEKLVEALQDVETLTMEKETCRRQHDEIKSSLETELQESNQKLKSQHEALEKEREEKKAAKELAECFEHKLGRSKKELEAAEEKNS